MGETGDEVTHILLPKQRLLAWAERVDRHVVLAEKRKGYAAAMDLRAIAAEMRLERARQQVLEAANRMSGKKLNGKPKQENP